MSEKYPEHQMYCKADENGKYAGAVLAHTDNGISNDAEIDTWLAEGAFPVTHGLGTTNEHGRFLLDEIRYDKSTGTFYDYVKPEAEVQAEQLAATKSNLINFVQTTLDSKAHEKNYDNGFACASYAISTNATFANEAAKYVKWRDEVWITCYKILDKALAGIKYVDTWANAIPTEAELAAALPTLEW